MEMAVPVTPLPNNGIYLQQKKHWDFPQAFALSNSFSISDCLLKINPFYSSSSN